MTTTADKTDWDTWNRDHSPRYPHACVVKFCLREFTTPDVRSATRVLDLGCGSGANAWFLAREGFQVVASDISEAGLARTRERLAADGLDAETRREGADRIGLAADTVDLIVCTGVFDSIGPETAGAAVGECARVLRPEGRGLFVFAAQGDFRIAPGRMIALHGYERSQVEALFRGRFGHVDIDQHITTYENGARQQIDWLVTVVR